MDGGFRDPIDALVINTSLIGTPLMNMATFLGSRTFCLTDDIRRQVTENENGDKALVASSVTDGEVNLPEESKSPIPFSDGFP